MIVILFTCYDVQELSDLFFFLLHSVDRGFCHNNIGEFKEKHAIQERIWAICRCLLKKERNIPIIVVSVVF